MPSPKYHVYGLDETYPELGKYVFKIVLNSRYYRSGEEFEVDLVDSDRKLMDYCVHKWGRKLNVEFTISSSTSDGVSVGRVLKGDQEVGRVNFWVIKP